MIIISSSKANSGIILQVINLSSSFIGAYNCISIIRYIPSYIYPGRSVGGMGLFDRPNNFYVAMLENGESKEKESTASIARVGRDRANDETPMPPLPPFWKHCRLRSHHNFGADGVRPTDRPIIPPYRSRVEPRKQYRFFTTDSV